METDRNGMTILTRSECLDRLGRCGIGRIGVTIGSLPAILPVNFAVEDAEIYFRTASGTKLAAASRNAIVAFEVDEVDRFSHLGWSVLIIGPSAQIQDPFELERLDSLPLARWVNGGPRTLVRIRPELVSGRRITHAAIAPGEMRKPRSLLCVCPGCGSDALRGVAGGDLTNFVCTSCMSCWHVTLGSVHRVPWATCPGCDIAGACRAAHAVIA